MKKLLIALAIFTIIGISFSGCKRGGSSSQSGEKTVTLNLSVPDPVNSYIHKAASEFVKRAKEYSGDTLNITISANGSLYGGDASAGIKQLSAGALDIVILSTALYSSFNKVYNIISVPFLFDNQQQLMDYLNSDIGITLMNSVSNMGITTVGRWTRSFRKITTSKKAINTPSDLNSIVLRVPNNTLFVSFFSKCGAATTPMSFSEVYNALQLKTLDAQENPIDVPFSNKFWEVQKYISGTDHMADAWLVGINSKKMSTLSKNQQDAIKKAGEEVQSWNVEFMKAEDKIAFDTLIKNGMVYNDITPENRQKFIDVAKSLYATFQELVGDKALFEETVKFIGK